MLESIIAILIISSIAALLAALLVLSESYISNYGPCEVDINAGEKKLTVQGGNSVLSSLAENEIYISSACGGRGTCGYCKVKVLEGGGPLLPTEEPFLTAEEIASNTRLSCQVKIRGPIRLEIPPEMLAVKQFSATCIDILELTYDTRQFRFKLDDPTQIDFVAGQYVQLVCPKYERSDEDVQRAYSISSDPLKKGEIELIIRLVPEGICTTWLFQYLKVGDPVKLNGPFGEFRLAETDAPMIMIAGGSGMAPMKSILHHMKNTTCQKKALYFFGGRSPKDVFMLDEMRQFEQDLPNFEFIPVVNGAEGEPWEGEVGLVTEAVQRRFDSFPEGEAYLCGSPGMINASIKTLNQLGIPEDKIYYDSFA
jgi:Na+-transporting NADH:ubiquinone oxidoreductase subunit F